MSGVMLHELK